MRNRIQTLQIARKDQQLDVHGGHQTVCSKQNRSGDPNRNCENIESNYRNETWHRKIRDARNEKWQTTHDGLRRTIK